MSWQDRARTALAHKEISAALKTLKDDEERKIDLSGKSFNLLETLMIEGDLLEVTLDESNQIWKILKSLEPRRSKIFPDLKDLEAELENAKEAKLRAKKKRKINTPSDNGLPQSSGDEAVSKKKPNHNRGGSSSNRKKPSSSSSALSKKKAESSSEDEAEDCSAKPSCKKPVGKEVHWVQCDGCELWFHLYCIGLKQEQVKEDEEFICKACKPPINKD